MSHLYVSNNSAQMNKPLLKSNFHRPVFWEENYPLIKGAPEPYLPIVDKKKKKGGQFDTRIGDR